MNAADIESAAFDAATGTIILTVCGRPPVRLTASPAVLRDLKAAVLDCYAASAGRPARPRTTKAG